MATSQCTSCGLILQHCQCRRQASTTVSSSAENKATDVTPACCCACYSSLTMLFFFFLLFFSGKQFIGKPGCYLELFASSVTVSNLNANTNISTADWRIGLVARSPVTRCKISFRTIKSRLLRGDHHEVVSESAPWLDGFGQLVPSDTMYEPVISVDFKGVAMPGVVGNMVRGYKVQIAVGLKTVDGHGSLMVLCGDLPVKFTAEPEGNVIGSLLGNMKRCEYVYSEIT